MSKTQRSAELNNTRIPPAPARRVFVSKLNSLCFRLLLRAIFALICGIVAVYVFALTNNIDAELSLIFTIWSVAAMFFMLFVCAGVSVAEYFFNDRPYNLWLQKKTEQLQAQEAATDA